MNHYTTANKQVWKKTILSSVIGMLAMSTQAEQKKEVPSFELEEIVTIGTRVAGRTAADAAVPIDVIDSEALTKNGFTELGQSLQSSAPSFNFSRTQVSDGSDLFRPATLRGLQPDQTLVLVNGKRRHTQSIFGNQGTVGGGSAGTDMNAIPLTALEAVEVLRDGAAAQYGSDAIAGVINLKLKDSVDETTGFLQWGSTGEGDGDTATLGLNTGFELGGDGGFINLSGEFRDFDRTNRADNPLWHQGDAEGEFTSLFYNAMLPLAGGELYSFGGYSKRTALGSGFRRRATSAAQNIPQVYPDGFTPNIDNEAEDTSFAIGYRRELSSGWQLDSSVAYGINEYSFASANTINPSIAAEYLFNNPDATDDEIAANAGPRSGHSADFEFEQTTFNLDLNGEVAMGDNPLYVAFGLEYRDEAYGIGQGVPASYSCGSSNADNSFPSVIDPSVFASCGFEAYPGISPEAETDISRDSYALYVDFERNMTEDWLLGAALRYEDYQGIGDETVGKLSSRYQLSENLAIRGALATGFRAPSLPQSGYQAFATNLNNDGTLARSYTAAAGSALPVALGIDNLEIETSQSVSLGFVLDLDAVTITVDAYSVEIDDRIGLGSNISATDLQGNQEALDALEATGVAEARFFSNAINTTTQGVDLIVSYDTELAGGDLNMVLAANYNETEIDSLNIPEGTTENQIFSSISQSFVTGGQPNERGTLTLNWSRDRLTGLLRVNYFGETEVDFFAGNHIGIPNTQPTSVVESAVLVDIDFSYDLTENVTLSVGGNNIFDERPDELDNDEVLDIISGGAFRYPLRAVPYGFNGASYYLKASFAF
ncbi:TonB-dependent receptor plug domain-containing protein [Pseudomaricurvus alkylphenolicus]|uniref:TonB-dependent receptor plug domain-containing protein n=1 Tax=Pseudomaricurvus alkylphenolicus TaxID=1306991 RepID=UPI00197F581B|nr:TonB-dependent receptor [Pseudomaricurvus alkylphenolicus]